MIELTLRKSILFECYNEERKKEEESFIK